MCSITLTAQNVTMATTQLMLAAACEISWPQLEPEPVEYRPPRMNWVVVTDEKHKRRMQMLWTPSADKR